MIKLKVSNLLSPLGIFFIYVLAAGLAIMGFRFIFPGEAVPLACFSVSWRLVKGFLEFLEFFPAIALSSLVVPFGFILLVNDKSSSFSPQNIQSLKRLIITAIAASALYGLLFSLALPTAQKYETNLLSQSQLYKLALGRAHENASEDEWDDTLQFVAICERIWPGGSDHSRLRIEAEIRTEEERLNTPPLPVHPAGWQAGLPTGQALTLIEALELAEKALVEERYFDAHWLATLAGRLAKPGSVEVATATRLAGRAWSAVNSMAPNARETLAYTIYRLKREGYEALIGEEWIRSYYIFLELLNLSPADPDAIKYLALSEEGVKRAAFFIDEIELTIGKILTGAVFSVPYGNGRLVMRIASLSTSPDTAYGITTEIMAFDNDGKPLWSINAPYAKILPLTLDSGPSLTILLRALDRTDKSIRWEPEIKRIAQSAPAGAELVLPLSWDSFLLLSNVRRGLSGLSPAELRSAAENLASCGYLPQVFQAELLQRFAKPLFLLPLGIFAIAFGWQFRALKRPRYIAIPMLGILPMVFHGAVHFIYSWLNDLGIWAITTFGFNTAAIIFGGGIVVILVLSLIYLAIKRN